MNPSSYIHNAIVVFCYLVKDGKVLLIERGQPPMKGDITIPGGKKKRGEDLLAACKREVQEETGLVVEKAELRGLVHTLSDQNDFEVLAVYFRSDKFSGEVHAGDEGELQWCDIAESYGKEHISEFYKAISPFVFEHPGIFMGTVKAEGAKIVKVDLY